MNTNDMRKRLTQALDDDYANLVSADRYYRGIQPLAYLDPEVRKALRGRLKPVVINWPRITVEAINDRLDVTGFRSAARPQAADDIWQLWQSNSLDEKSQQAHTDALVYGRSYVLIWSGRDPQVPTVSIESPLQTIHETDPSTGDTIAALKRWRDLDGYGRAILFTPEAVVQYRSNHRSPDASAALDTDYAVIAEEANPLGLVPVVPIVNRPRPLLPRGESELADAMPIADAINKCATDLMVSAEYHAQPRRWVTGFGGSTVGGRLTEEQLATLRENVKAHWEEARGSKVWISDSTDTKFGQFPEAMLDNFVSAIRMFTLQLSAVAGLPPHYVALSAESNPASADAIRSAEASLVHRARRRQRIWGGSWEEAMRIALAIRDGAYPVGLDDLETVWASPEIVSISQAADAAVKLHAEGILDRRAVLEGLDYSPQAITQITT